MSRFLLTVWPLVGHINPFMSVAKALQARGHSVAFYTSESVRPILEAEGMMVLPYVLVDDGPMWEIVRDAESRAWLGWNAPKILMRAVREWIAGTMPGQVADLRRISAEWKPDVIVTETGMWGPIVVLNEVGTVPVAILTTLMGCLIPGPEAPPGGSGLPTPRNFRTRLLSKAVTRLSDMLAVGVRMRVNRVRAENGLPPMAGSVNAHMATLPLYLVPSVRELDYGRRDLPSSVHYVGPCIWNRPSGQAPDRWLEGLPGGQPWVHVTEGTAHYQDPFVLRAAASGLAGLPLQAILTTGSQRDPEEMGLGAVASNIHVRRWVSHSELLPRCAALVTTGGAGTILTALHAGLPMVIVPTHWDKPDNARRIVDAGLGLSLSPRRCTPEALRHAVERVLAEPGYRENARGLALKMNATSGPERAADLLEALALKSAQRGEDFAEKSRASTAQQEVCGPLEWASIDP
ncbi:glycosyltransferase [Isosphaeraceae bacterium EP7]